MQVLIPGTRSWNLPEKYEVKQLIGSGFMGRVCEAYDKEQEKLVAIKQFKNLSEDTAHSKEVLRDLAILSDLNHECILGVYDMVAGTDPLAELYIIQEICDADLKKLCRMDVVLTPIHINSLLYNLLLGVNHLHSAGIIHCNLKPAHCLVNQDCAVKICDLGISSVLAGDGQYAKAPPTTPRQEAYIPPATTGGTQPVHTQRMRRHVRMPITRKWYSAPELLLMQEAITAAVDLWSVACIYAELLGMLPGRGVMDREPLFPGSCQVEDWFVPSSGTVAYSKYNSGQLRTVFSTLGTPSEADLQWLDSDEVRQYVMSFDSREGDLSTKFPMASEESIAMLQQLLEFVPSARASAGKALKHSLFSDVRDPTKEVLASHRVQLACLKDDEVSLRASFCEELAKFPRRDFFVTLDMQAIQASATVVCTNMAGNDLLSLTFPDPRQASLGELREKVVKHLGIRTPYVKLLLPDGRLLGNEDNSTSLYDLLAVPQ
mmetsp:Transcript_95450/g.169475  ORF Transcript_95450/g.169475 Transcript_95450/m.169475 type:complete len:489 (-) Transcript_95450:69-1535(-)